MLHPRRRAAKALKEQQLGWFGSMNSMFEEAMWDMSRSVGGSSYDEPEQVGTRRRATRWNQARKPQQQAEGYCVPDDRMPVPLLLPEEERFYRRC